MKFDSWWRNAAILLHSEVSYSHALILMFIPQYSAAAIIGLLSSLERIAKRCEVVGMDNQLTYLAVWTPDNLVIVVKFATALPWIEKMHGQPLPEFVSGALERAHSGQFNPLQLGLLAAVPSLDAAEVFFVTLVTAGNADFKHLPLRE